MVDFLPGLLYGIGRKSDKKTGVGEIFWEDGSGEKRNLCELVTVFRECKALILADSRKQMGHWETGKAAKCEDL